MIRILVYVALVFAVAAGFAWLADRPGDLALTWQGYQVQTSLMVAAVGLAVLFIVLALALWLLVTIFRAPAIFNGWIGGRRRDRGYRSLSRGMIAIGAGDLKRAKRYALETRKILHDEPLTLLLTAQTAQLGGDGAAARAAFEAMVAVPETRLLGLRGLFVEAQRAGEHEAARHYAEEAVKTAPTLAWAGTALFDYQAAGGEWRAALLTLGSNINAKLIDRSKAHRLRAVLLTARGMELELSDSSRSPDRGAGRGEARARPCAGGDARSPAMGPARRREARVEDPGGKLEAHAAPGIGRGLCRGTAGRFDPRPAEARRAARKPGPRSRREPSRRRPRSHRCAGFRHRQARTGRDRRNAADRAVLPADGRDRG